MRPGLSDDEITRALAAEGLSCPDDLRTWFGWHDGADTSQPGLLSGDDGLGLGWHTLTLEGALFIHRETLQDSTPELLPRSWFPVVILNGTTLNVDTAVPEHPPLYIVGDSLQNGTPPRQQFPSLSAYVHALIRVYREHLVVEDKMDGAAWADPDIMPDPELRPLDRW